MWTKGNASRRQEIKSRREVVRESPPLVYRRLLRSEFRTDPTPRLWGRWHVRDDNRGHLVDTSSPPTSSETGRTPWRRQEVNTGDESKYTGVSLWQMENTKTTRDGEGFCHSSPFPLSLPQSLGWCGWCHNSWVVYTQAPRPDIRERSYSDIIQIPMCLCAEISSL